MSIGVTIVDDGTPAREILASWIRHADGFHCVGEFDDAETALDHLPNEKPSILLFDMNPRGMDSVECIRRLKPSLPNTQFLLLTVYEDVNHIFNALAAGASGYLLKQIRRDELIAVLKNVHAGGAPMSSWVARKVIQSFARNEAGIAGETSGLAGCDRELLQHLACGCQYHEVAGQLKISVPAVSVRIRKIYDQFHAHFCPQTVARHPWQLAGAAA